MRLERLAGSRVRGVVCFLAVCYMLAAVEITAVKVAAFKVASGKLNDLMRLGPIDGKIAIRVLIDRPMLCHN